MTDKREYLDLAEIDGVDDYIEFVANDDKLHITASNDWAGCTETGFGESGNVTLNKEQVKELYEFLGRFLAI